MDQIFNNLHLNDEKKILILNMPDSFKPKIRGLIGDHVVVDEERAPSTVYHFALIFTYNMDEIGVTASMLIKSLDRKSATFWVAFPINSPDIPANGEWEVMEQIGYRKLEFLPINQEWAAFRFGK